MDQKDLDRLLKRAYSLAKGKAKSRKLKFTLDLDSYSQLIKENCDYCGAEPSNMLEYYGLYLKYSGLDRLDQSGGYEPGNVVPCCRFCNSLRGPMPLSTWIDFLKGVSEWGSSWPRWTDLDVEPDHDRPTKAYYAYSGRRKKQP